MSLLPPVTDRDHLIGRTDAPAMLVLYGDYECPYTRVANLAIGRVRRRMGDTLGFVFRHFPLRPVHPHAQNAAEAAEEAGAQGKFWEMHELLFQNQEALDDASLVRYATRLGLNGVRVHDALQSHEHEARTDEDLLSGYASGVRGTPALFMNGHRYPGDRDVASLEQALREVIDAPAEQALRTSSSQEGELRT